MAEGLDVGPLPLGSVSALVELGKVPTNMALRDADGHELGLILEQPELQEAIRVWTSSQSTAALPPASPSIKLVEGLSAPVSAPAAPEASPAPEAPIVLPAPVPEVSVADAVVGGYVDDWAELGGAFDSPVSEDPEDLPPAAEVDPGLTTKSDPAPRSKPGDAFSAEWIDEDVVASVDLVQTDLPALRRLGLSLLQQGKFFNAIDVLEQYLLQVPEHREALSARAFCRFHLARDHQERVGQLEAVHGLMAADSTTLWMLLFAIRMNLVLQRTRVAEDLLVVAEGTQSEDMDAMASVPMVRQMVEARRLDLDGARARTRGQVPEQTPKSFEVHASTSKEPEYYIRPVSPLGRPAAAILVLALICGIVGAAAIGAGAQEVIYSADNLFFWFRRGLLLIVGLGASWAAFGSQILNPDRWRPSAVAVGVALSFGTIVGLLSPSQPHASALAVVVLMAVVHVVAEESFFRLYLDPVLGKVLPGWTAAVVSGVLFGIYHLTYAHMQTSMSFLGALQWAGLVALCAGIPLSLLFHKTRSFVPPLIAHLGINIIMMLRSGLL